ncbi:hypothetical protein NHG32_03765 [Aerococcaceae bacterium NML191219]|nr:hypothetical protein [Aerococcaceae bacterium NML191219]
MANDWKYSFYHLTENIENYKGRTLEVYQRNGVSIIGESHMSSNGGIHRFIHMEKEL